MLFLVWSWFSWILLNKIPKELFYNLISCFIVRIVSTCKFNFENSENDEISIVNNNTAACSIWMRQNYVEECSCVCVYNLSFLVLVYNFSWLILFYSRFCCCFSNWQHDSVSSFQILLLLSLHLPKSCKFWIFFLCCPALGYSENI